MRGICKEGLEWQFGDSTLNLVCHPTVKCFALLISLFPLHSCTMVDGVMILPVLMMIAFPSPSMEGKWLTTVWARTRYCILFILLSTSLFIILSDLAILPFPHFYDLFF